MRERIVSGSVGGVLLIILLYFRDSIILNIALSLLIVLALWEVFVVTKYVTNKLLLTVSLIFAALFPFFKVPGLNMPAKLTCLVYIIFLFCIMIANRKEISLERIGLVFMMSVLIPLSFSSMLYLRNIPYEQHFKYQAGDGLFFIILAISCAWVTDIGAYFAGRFFGKHKMAPHISPKKTIEGAVGGVIVNLIATLIICLVWQNFVVGDLGSVRVVPIMLISIFGSLIGILGDLSASCIKRSCNIKDFGNIMPGHGGVMDRFDSLMMVMPFIYVLAQAMPFIYY